jgi:hypothetical protein
LTAEQVVVGASIRGLLSKRIAGAVVRVRHGRLALGDAATSQPAPRPANREPSATRDRAAGAPEQTPAAVDGAQKQDPSGFTIDSVSEIVFDDVVVNCNEEGAAGECRGILAPGSSFH